MYVLEHYTRAGARVLRIRPQASVDELLEAAESGDLMYTAPDTVCGDADKLVRYLKGRQGVRVA